MSGHCREEPQTHSDRTSRNPLFNSDKVKGHLILNPCTVQPSHRIYFAGGLVIVRGNPAGADFMFSRLHSTDLIEKIATSTKNIVLMVLV